MWNDSPDKKLEKLQRSWDVELAVASYLQSLRFGVIHRGKGNGLEKHGPQIGISKQVLAQGLPIPDLEIFFLYRSTQLPPHNLPTKFFADVKEKPAGCSWYRTNGRYQSGIDRYAWENYKKFERVTDTQTGIIHLIQPTSDEVLDRQGAPLNKRPAPTGLFWHPILLKTADEHAPSQMVYWGIDDMQKIAELDQILSLLSGDISA